MNKKMSGQPQKRTVSCEQGSITYLLTRKPVKNINIRVKSDGCVLVSANRKISLSELDELIRSRQVFILRALSKYEALRNRRKEAESLGQYLNGGKKEVFPREILYQVCQEIYPLFRKYGVEYPEIKIRQMKSQWGSCRPNNKVITLNSRLLEVPREAIEYVVLHEFAHFIHPNHSKEFYRLIEQFMPDWKERKRLLEGVI